MDIEKFQNLQQITTEILVFKQQAAVNIIEIGRRLLQAKEMIPHGQWGRWLEEKVEFSHRTANNFMKAAEEYSNSQSLANLPPTKIFALLDLPAEDREQFVQQPHELPTGETKTVDDMTTRELQEAIKAQKEAEKKARELERQLAEAQDREPETIIKEVVPEEVKRQLSEAQMKAREIDKVKAENKKLRFELEAAKSNPVDDRMELEAKVSTFTGRIKGFLVQMAPLGYMGQEVMRTSPQAQREYETSIVALEKWCQDMRDAMIKPRETKIIDVEVIQ